jgi:hypothetical protein
MKELIRQILKEETSLIQKIKNFFSKDVPEDKRVDFIVKNIIPRLKLNNTFPHFDSDGNLIFRYKIDEELVMTYDTENNTVEYTESFANRLYRIFPDKRLLDENSKMIGKIFEKTYNVKVKRSFGGYSYL